jgi:WD40 repeat protein
VGQDRFARVYYLATGELVHVLPQGGFVHCVAFDPRGVLLLTCGHEGVARVWSLTSGNLVKHLYGPGPKSPVVDGTFAPNGILVAAGIADGTARVWEAATGFQRGIAFGHISPVTHVAFSPTGRSFVTGSLDDRARTWVVNGRPVAILAGHRGPLNSVQFSPDSRSILTSSEDGTARLWDSGTQPQLALLARQQSITAFALSSDGMRVAVGDARGVGRVRAITRATVLETVRARGPITAVAFGPRGPIAATRPTLSLAVWRGSVARGMNNGSVLIADGHRRVRLRTRSGPVTALAFSPDGHRLATGDASGNATLWDLSTRRKVRTLRAHALAITSVVFAPDGHKLLTASRDHIARTWNLRTGRGEAVRRWHVGPLGGATFSPDGQWVLTAGPSAAGVGKVSSNRPSLFLRGPTKMAPLVGAAFGGRDRRLIVVASKDGTIRTYHCDICGNLRELISLAVRRLNLR